MACKAFPCNDAQITLQILGVFDTVICLLVLITSGIGIGVLLGSPGEGEHAPTIGAQTFAIVSPIVAQIQFVLVCVLCVGANKRKYKVLKVWLIITLVLTFFHAVILATGAATYLIFFIVVRVIRILFTIYEILVVFYFMKELKENARQRKFYTEEGVIAPAEIALNVFQKDPASEIDHPLP